MNSVQTQNESGPFLPPNVLTQVVKRAPKEFLSVNTATSKSALQTRRTYVEDMKTMMIMKLSDEIIACFNYKQRYTLECNLKFQTSVSKQWSNEGVISYRKSGDPVLQLKISNRIPGDSKCLRRGSNNTTTLYVLKDDKPLTGACIYPYLEKFFTDFFQNTDKIATVCYEGMNEPDNHKKNIAEIFGKQEKDWAKKETNHPTYESFTLQIGGKRKTANTKPRNSGKSK